MRGPPLYNNDDNDDNDDNDYDSDDDDSDNGDNSDNDNEDNSNPSWRADIEFVDMSGDAIAEFSLLLRNPYVQVE